MLSSRQKCFPSSPFYFLHGIIVSNNQIPLTAFWALCWWDFFIFFQSLSSDKPFCFNFKKSKEISHGPDVCFFPLSTACLWSLFALFRNRDDRPFECLIIFFLSPERQGLSSERALQSSVTNLLEEWYLRKLQNFHFFKKFPFLCCNLSVLLFLQWSGWSCGTYGIGWYLSLINLSLPRNRKFGHMANDQESWSAGFFKVLLV